MSPWPMVVLAMCALSLQSTGKALTAPEPTAKAAQPASLPLAAAQRRRLAADFIAAGDRASTIVQWLQMPASERLALDGMTESRRSMLNRRSVSALKSGNDTLAFFRFMNEPSTQLTFIQADYLSSLQDAPPERDGRQYVAWWEIRNLRRVAKVRAAFGNRPGAKVLTVVGASHKPYDEAYLDLMHDVQLVDAQAVLR